MKLSLFTVAVVTGLALAGSASAQGLVNGVAGSDQNQMAPVGTKAPSSGDMSSSRTTTYSDRNTTAMNDNDSRIYSSDSTANAAPNQLVNGVPGPNQTGMSQPGSKGVNSGANSTGEAMER